jgi:tetratricopeptide (TPR) repeat protein
MLAADQNVRTTECEQKWVELSRERRSDTKPSVLLAAWKTHERQCKGTGVYEIRLASIFTEMEQFDSARTTLAQVSVPEKYKAQAEVLEINIDYLAALSSDDVDRAALQNLELRATTFLKAKPNANAVIGILGHVRIILGKYREAIEPLEKLVTGPSGGDLTDNRNLTIAYANSERYTDALEMLDRTYALSKEVTSDEEFMYAAILAYAAVGKVDAAKTMLTLILNKKPHLKSDVRFAEIVFRAKQLSNGMLK